MESLKIIGIACKNYGEIVNCKFIGQINSTDNWGYNKGGIVEENYGLIKECGNEGKIGYSGVCSYGSGVCRYGKKLAGICIVNYGTIDTSFNRGLLKNIDYSGADTAGISVENHGIIDNCYNSGKIEHGASGSGIVGENFEDGIIKSCYNVGNIVLEEKVGSNVTHAQGICNVNKGTIEECYNAGNITSGSSVGLVSLNCNKLSNCYKQEKITTLWGTEYNGRGDCSGINITNEGTIDNCYNIGIINAHEFVNSANIANSNWGSISGCYYLESNSSNDIYSEGLSFTEMQQQESFEGFDFDTVWQIDSNADYYFPTLRGIENKTILPKNVETELITTNSITIKNIEGYEYSIDGENYQDSNMFENLTSSTEYTIYQRIKKTETTDESIAAYTSVKTLTYIGDINGDGKVNITDVALINAHVKKTKLLTGEELARADINGDGKVNITDVALVNAHVKKVKLLF